MASGTTHINGIDEMFWVRWFEIASNKIEPSPESAIQVSLSRGVGLSIWSDPAANVFWCGPLTFSPSPRNPNHADAAINMAKTPNPIDQPIACCCVVIHGSNKNG